LVAAAETMAAFCLSERVLKSAHKPSSLQSLQSFLPETLFVKLLF